MTVRRTVPRAGAVVAPDAWPDRVPGVRQLLTDGFAVPRGVTFLARENGAGRSTLVEALAGVLGAHVEGGTPHHHAGPDRGTRSDRSTSPGRLRVVRGAGGPKDAFSLRAETMHRFHDHHQRSHGECFLDLLESRCVRGAGVLLLDEPESASSFDDCLVLAGALTATARGGEQVLCATHSPLITAVPGARTLQVEQNGLTPVGGEDLRIVGNWRSLPHAPERFLRRVL